MTALGPEALAQVTSMTPASIMGWGAFVISTLTFSMLVWQKVTQRGRSLASIDGKIDRICEKVEEMEGQLVVFAGLSESVRELTQEWRGVNGENGYKSIIRENTRAIAEILRRNDRLDAIREADERRSGGQHRRLSDRERNKLLPEDREGKP